MSEQPPSNQIYGVWPESHVTRRDWLLQVDFRTESTGWLFRSFPPALMLLKLCNYFIRCSWTEIFILYLCMKYLYIIYLFILCKFRQKWIRVFERELWKINVHTHTQKAPVRIRSDWPADVRWRWTARRKTYFFIAVLCSIYICRTLFLLAIKSTWLELNFLFPPPPRDQR